MAKTMIKEQSLSGSERPFFRLTKPRSSKHGWSVILPAVMLALMAPGRAVAGPVNSADDAAIRAVVFRYGEALNQHDLAAAMSVYADDAVSMTPMHPSLVGKDAIKAAYGGGFEAVALNVKFEIAEVVLTSPDWAFVRSNSSGTSTVKSSGVQRPEANQELFILRKSDQQSWRIERYSFSPTSAPQ